jgi:hypothetical protein
MVYHLLSIKEYRVVESLVLSFGIYSHCSNLRKNLIVHFAVGKDTEPIKAQLFIGLTPVSAENISKVTCAKSRKKLKTILENDHDTGYSPHCFYTL